MKARTVFESLFSFSGRTARKPFWIANVADYIKPNKPNYSPKKSNVMKNTNLLSKTVGTLLLLVVMVQNAVAGVPQTPYQKLQKILNEYYIYKEAVTDELTAREVERVYVEVANQFNVPEYLVKKSKTVGEMLTNILEYKYDGKKGAEGAWRRIQYSGKYEDYALFMLIYPKSKHLTEAYSKFIVTRLYDAFISLWESDSIEEDCREYLHLYLICSNYYETFIRKYECGGCGIQCIDYEGISFLNPEEWAEAVREYLQEKETERQLWKDVLREGTHDAYWNYYLKYPGSKFADTALIKVRDLEQSAWDNALVKDNRESYEAFVEQFPQGIYSIEAYNKIVHSHLDTTSAEAVNDALQVSCEYNRPNYSLIGIANVNIKNKTYTITLSGELGYRMVLEPGEYKWIEVMDGDYEILVEADGVQPWWGVTSCSGHLYAGAWYVGTESLFLPPTPIRKHHPLSMPFLQGNFNVPEKPFETVFSDKNPEVDQEAKDRFIKAIHNQCNEQ